MIKSKKCFECKKSFPRYELIDYASPNSKSMQSYCPECLQKKQNRDKFSAAVCVIFGIKSPGPRMWTERKRLMETYGYTDNIIIDCLNYVYKVEKHKRDVESLYLVTPSAVDRMLQYKCKKEEQMAGAAMPKYEKYYIPPAPDGTQDIRTAFLDPDNLSEWD